MVAGAVQVASKHALSDRVRRRDIDRAKRAGSATLVLGLVQLDRVGFVRRRLDGTIPASRFMTHAEFEHRPPRTMTELLGRMGSFRQRCDEVATFVDGVLMAARPLPDSTELKALRFGAVAKP